MNKLIIILSFFIIMPVLAQTEENNQYQEETLFGGGDVRKTGYGALEFKSAYVNGNWNGYVGGRGGVIFNSVFSIGGAGYIMFTSSRINGYQEPVLFPDNDYYLRDMYAGLFLEYINSSNSVIHFTLNSLIGGGVAAYTSPMTHSGHDYRRDDFKIYESSGYFVFEPGATIDVNFTKFMRLSVGASYRVIAGLALPEPISAKDIGGPSINLMLKFGKF